MKTVRFKVGYTLLMSVPAAAAIAMAPSAAADTPVCTGDQTAQFDNCVPAPPPCGGIMCLTANGAQDVYVPEYPPLAPPASGPDANGSATPPVGTPPSEGCSGIACLTANGAQDVYTP
jgi:hypothetical protein